MTWLLGLIILAALQVADVLTTNKVIAGGGRESNPALVWIMRHTGKWWWTVKLALAFAAIGILWLIGESVVSWAVLAFLLVAYGWVVWHNWNEAK